jgi:hypothetical protein
MTTASSRAIAAVVATGAIIGGFFYLTRSPDYSAISTYDECRNAGFEIMESYPEQCRTPDGRTFANQSSSTTTDATSTPAAGKEDKIRVTNITANQVISSPVTIEGSARGYWYFEASFPVELVDGNGKTVAIGPAQAQAEWMTTEFVPFSITLSFAKPTTPTGTLILRNDNPSGLPENADELRIPIRFSSSERAVKLYYYDSRLDTDAQGSVLCSAKGLVAVNRTIPVTQTPLLDTIRLLLRGDLTSSERATGVTTEFPLDRVSISSATISGSGNATLTFQDPDNRTSGGACRAQVLRAQIEATAKQFSTVKSVTLSPPTLFQP